MCGICGVVDFNNSLKDKNTIRDLMSKKLIHRGPDDKGEYDDNKVSLGFRRLSILDVNKGNQPVLNYNKTIIAIFNGEIFNYKEIRSDLKKKGYVFHSNSDSEIIPHAFDCWGIDFINKLNGMFSIAIYDKRKNCFYLIRDRLGIKPLYYFKENQVLYFSSEINSLIASPLYKKKINLKAVSAYLSFRYPTEDEDTFFLGVKRLPAGSFLEISNVQEKILKYWQIPFPNSLKLEKESYYLEKLDFLLNTSIKRQLISDVPLGVFLSGGLDSSLLSALAAKYTGKNLNTFSISVQKDEYNESEKALLVSKHLSTNHHEVILEKEDFLENLDNLIDIKGVPASIPHEYALYLLSKEMKKKISVVLSGEGADEFFGGYSRVQRSPFDYDIQELINKMKLNNTKKNNQSFFDFILNRYSWFNPSEKSKLLSSIFKKDVKNDENLFSDWKKILTNGDLEKNYSKVLFMFQNKHLKCLLDRLDSMTMAASVEARVPYLDHELIEFINSVPFDFKLRWKSYFHKIISVFSSSNNYTEKNDINKYLLRKISENYLPKKISQAKKLGFPIPLNDWINNSEIKNLISGKNSLSKNFYNQNYLDEIFSMKQNRNYDFAGKKIWMLLNIEIWLKKHFA